MSHWRGQIVDIDGTHSLYVVPGHAAIHLINLDVEDCDAETAFMLVDLSNTTDWPHGETGHIHLAGVDIFLDPDGSFVGDIELGFLENVDATNGDLRIIHTWHFDKARLVMADHLSWVWSEFQCAAASWFGPSVVDSLLFQTDVNLQAPDGVVDAPSGDGDLVLRVARTAGAIDIAVTVQYEAHA